MQQSTSLHSGQSSKYGAGPLNEHLSSLKHITVATHREHFNDPLGVAERGKVGLPPSSSECSSNSSADASVESNMGLLNGERKGTTLLTIKINICPMWNDNNNNWLELLLLLYRSTTLDTGFEVARFTIHIDNIEGDTHRQSY